MTKTYYISPDAGTFTIRDVECEYKTFYKLNNNFYLIDYLRAIKENCKVSLPYNWRCECFIDFYAKLYNDSSYSHNITSAQTYTSCGTQYDYNADEFIADYNSLASCYGDTPDALTETTSQHYNIETALDADIDDINDITMTLTIYDDVGYIFDELEYSLADFVNLQQNNYESFDNIGEVQTSYPNSTSFYSFNIWVPKVLNLNTIGGFDDTYTIDNSSNGINITAKTTGGSAINGITVTLIPACTTATTSFPFEIEKKIISDFTISKYSSSNSVSFSASELGKIHYYLVIQKPGYEFYTDSTLKRNISVSKFLCTSIVYTTASITFYGKSESATNSFYFYLQDENNISYNSYEYTSAYSQKKPRVSSLQVGNTLSNKQVDFAIFFKMNPYGDRRMICTSTNSSSAPTGTTTISGYSFSYQFLYSQTIGPMSGGCLCLVTCTNGPVHGFNPLQFSIDPAIHYTAYTQFDSRIKVTDIYSLEKNNNTRALEDAKLNFYEYQEATSSTNVVEMRKHRVYFVGLPIYKVKTGLDTTKISTLNYYLYEFAAAVTFCVSNESDTAYGYAQSDALSELQYKLEDDSGSYITRNRTISPAIRTNSETYPYSLVDTWEYASQQSDYYPIPFVRTVAYITNLTNNPEAITPSSSNFVHTKQMTYANTYDDLHNDILNNYVIFYANADSTIKFNKLYDNHTIWITNPLSNAAKKYKYTGGNTWRKVTAGESISLKSGDFLCMKGILNITHSTSRYTNIYITGQVYAAGNIMGLLNYANPSSSHARYAACYGLFSGSTGLYTSPELPATKLENYCYAEMFHGCTNLKTSPSLPARIIGPYAYSHMFDGCTSLVCAGEISAVWINTGSMQYMFQNCSNLKNIQESLYPFKIPNYGCQYMFNMCTSLQSSLYLSTYDIGEYGCRAMYRGCSYLSNATVLPTTTIGQYAYSEMYRGTSVTSLPSKMLPSTSLANYCYYYMFSYCTSLTVSPQLPAVTLKTACYRGMFEGRTSLMNAKAYTPLSAATLVQDCYAYMFNGCSSLKYIACLATNISASNCTTSWVNGVSSSGTFTKKSSATGWPRTINGIPASWSVTNV